MPYSDSAGQISCQSCHFLYKIFFVRNKVGGRPTINFNLTPRHILNCVIPRVLMYRAWKSVKGSDMEGSLGKKVYRLLYKDAQAHYRPISPICQEVPVNGFVSNWVCGVLLWTHSQLCHFCCAMLCISAAIAVMRCPSVCLSRSWIIIMSKRINISSKFFNHRVATPLNGVAIFPRKRP